MLASLLDRLISSGDDLSQGSVQQRALSFGLARAAVIRDLEALLNTRCFVTSLPETYREIARSVLAYGLGDHTSDNPGSSAVRAELRQEIERAIEYFEPRLRNVSVRVEDTEGKRRLRFKITAMLGLDKESEPVSFDTYMDINRGEFSVPR